MFKKLLIALLVVGAVAIVPSTEAGRRACKKEKACHKVKNCAPKRTFKQSCAPQCTEKTVVDHVKWIPCMVPGKKPVTCYKTTRTCVDTSECCDYETGEAVCLEPGEELE